MTRRFHGGWAIILAASTACAAAQEAAPGKPPRVLDDRLELQLFAEQPQVVTPTGIDVDHLGRVWVLESNTHFPPEGYQGHKSDRLLVMEDTDRDGKADKIATFADGLQFAMSVAVKPVWLDAPALSDAPPQGAGAKPADLTGVSVYVATRGEIVLLRDTDGDLQADERRRLVHLDTKGNYPHNGLAGIAFDALGWMFFGFGENLGEAYKIIGSDGATLSGGGEGGNVYRCRPDGSQLERWATGFWNPHASCFDAFGRLFTVDNDPDSRPPCRLLHIIPGGDYGYRFRNGRKGTHPFTAWNGEIPGTLPMVSGTGEAPSGILCYESDGFPEDYLGTLLVGSWGDHRIDKFVLEPQGASFVSRPQPIVQGDDNFRPVGLALAPDGSVYFSDWVLRDYKLHGKGRVWRLSGARKPTAPSGDGRAGAVSVARDADTLSRAASRNVRRAAARRLAAVDQGRAILLAKLNSPEGTARSRIEALWALASAYEKHPEKFLGPPQSPAAFLNRIDEVAEAAVRLGRIDMIARMQGSFPARITQHPTEPAVSRFLGEQIENYRPDLSRYNLAGVAWIALLTNESDPFLQFHAFHSMTDLKDLTISPESLSNTSQSDATRRLIDVYFLLLARHKQPQDAAVAKVGLASPWPGVRFAAVQWVGEERLQELRPQVEALLTDRRTTPDLLLACLATLSLLDGVPPSEFEKTPPATYALAIVADEKRPAALRATALRLLPPAAPELKSDLLVRLAQAPERALRTEAVRTLQQAPRPEALPVLLQLASDPQADVDLRADAVSALCAIVPHEQPLPADVESLLSRFARGDVPIGAPTAQSAARATLQLEALRALRGRAAEGSKLRQVVEAVRATAGGAHAPVGAAVELALTGKSTFTPQADADKASSADEAAIAAGRRTFFAHQGPLCFKCHTVHGRGGKVGPDLSTIARTLSRQKLIDSILDPSKEISPYFLTWTIATSTGKVHTGILVTENGGGDLELGDAQGNIVKIPRKEIEERAPSKVSTMPQGLQQRMTSQEFADLLAYLESLK